jgi:hypothetical protein
LKAAKLAKQSAKHLLDWRPPGRIGVHCQRSLLFHAQAKSDWSERDLPSGAQKAASQMTIATSNTSDEERLNGFQNLVLGHRLVECAVRVLRAHFVNTIAAQ